MTKKPNETFSVSFYTQNASGAATDADSTPTATFYRNGTLDAAVPLTVTSLGAATGGYKVNGTVPTGYVSGDFIAIHATAIVGGVTAREVIGRFEIDTKRDSEIAADTRDTLITHGLTAARLGYLDNANVGGLLASSAEATSISNNQRVVRAVPDFAERPDSGTQNYVLHVYTYTATGLVENPDSAPTVSVANQSDVSRNSRLSSTTMTQVATGHYKATYNVSSTDEIEQLLFNFSVTKSGVTRGYGNMMLIVDATAVDFTAADRATLAAVAADYARRTDIPGDYQQRNVAVTLPVSAALEATSQSIKAQTDLIPASPATAANVAAAQDTITDAIALIADSAGLTEEQAAQLTAVIGLLSNSIAPRNERLPENGNITLYQSIDYLAADGQAKSFSSASWPDLTGGRAWLRLSRRLPNGAYGPQLLEIESALSRVDDVQTADNDFTALQTAALPRREKLGFQLIGEDDHGHMHLLVAGVATIEGVIADA